MSTELAEVTVMKSVLVYSTVGSNRKEIQSAAVSWSELKRELAQNGISAEGMKAVVGQTQVTLESPDAQLPNEPFTLFLYPVQVKSGGFFGEDDDDNDENRNDDEPGADDDATDEYNQDDATNDLIDARDGINRVLQFLSNPNTVLNPPVILDEETKSLDDEAKALALKMGIRS